jgi:hypothetical protein
MVQYNQYVDPETDAIIGKIAEKKKDEQDKKHYSKTDVVLEILQKESKKYL